MSSRAKEVAECWDNMGLVEVDVDGVLGVRLYERRMLCRIGACLPCGKLGLKSAPASAPVPIFSLKFGAFWRMKGAVGP